jgi:hypothetical protein
MLSSGLLNGARAVVGKLYAAEIDEKILPVLAELNIEEV